MTFNTGNPVPSWDPRDLIDNADVVDEYVNSAANTVTTRTGVEKRTLASIENEAVQVISDFENAGGILTTAAEAAKNQAQIFRNEAGIFAGQAESARDDAVAVVYSGDATLEPAPGSIPVARADATIDYDWVGATRLPTIKPSLLLDFANSKTLDPRATYTCASPVPYYDGKSTVRAGENLVLQSEAFQTGNWTKARNTATADNVVAPNGTLTADTMTVSETSVSGAAIYNNPLTIAPAGVFVASWHVKQTSTDWVRVGAFNGVNAAFVYLNVTTQSVGTIGVAGTGFTYMDAGFEASSEGFLRVWVKFSTTGTAFAMILHIACAGDGSVACTLGDTAALWGAQLERRDFVTAYTPTTTAPITRYQPLLLEAPANTPAFDHDPVTGECLGLASWGQATNRALWSDDLANAVWAATNVDVASNQYIAPDGTLTADLLTATDANGTLIQDLGTVASAAKTGLFMVRSVTGSVTFDLTMDGGATLSERTATQDWVVVRILQTVANEDFGIRLRVSGDRLIAWRGGVVTGNYSGPPIKTEGSQVTRAAMVHTPQAGSGALGEGALYAEYQAASGTAIASIGTAAITAPDANTNKTVVAYDSTSRLTSTNGATATSASGSLGAAGLTLPVINGHFKKVAVYSKKPTQTQTEALTA